jgi:hypothetical protein
MFINDKFGKEVTVAYQVQSLQFAGGTDKNVLGEPFFEAEIQTHHFQTIHDIQLFPVEK